MPIEVRCGQCIGCRLDRSRQWAVRIMNEAQLHENSVFVTLTYSPENLPPGATLRKRDFQLFMKRLRKHYGQPVRYFHCGEYGEQLRRPHYHAVLFGVHFDDQELLKTTPAGNKLYRSETLDRLWGHGHASVGALTFESAAYTARYILKKVLGESAEKHYQRVELSTGEIIQLEPEYVTMSLKPGIGSTWYDQFKGDVFPSDFMVIQGKKQAVPMYYKRRLECENPKLATDLKWNRVRRAKQYRHDQTPSRLRVREEVTLSRSNQSQRNLEK